MARLREREPAPVDLADVTDEVGLVATGLTEQIRQATNDSSSENDVRPRSAFHDDNIGRLFMTVWGRL